MNKTAHEYIPWHKKELQYTGKTQMIQGCQLFSGALDF